MKLKNLLILCMLLNALRFTAYSQEIEGSLPEGYVAIRESDAKQYRQEMKAYKKLIQEHNNISQLYDELTIKYEKLLLDFKGLESNIIRMPEQRKKDLQALTEEVIKLRKSQEENRKTIANLKKAYWFCRGQVTKYNIKKGRRQMDRLIQLNGGNSALE